MTYSLYVDGGGQTIKDKVYPTYFSFRAFTPHNVPIPTIECQRFFLRSLVPLRYKILSFTKDGIEWSTYNTEDDVILPPNCSIRNWENKETNNIAEYAALYYGLLRFRKIKGEVPLQIFSDSELIVKQVNGVYYPTKHLKEWFLAVKSIMWGNCTLTHINRDKIVKILSH